MDSIQISLQEVSNAAFCISSLNRQIYDLLQAKKKDVNSLDTTWISDGGNAAAISSGRVLRMIYPGISSDEIASFCKAHAGKGSYRLWKMPEVIHCRDYPGKIIRGISCQSSEPIEAGISVQLVTVFADEAAFRRHQKRIVRSAGS